MKALTDAELAALLAAERAKALAAAAAICTRRGEAAPTFTVQRALDAAAREITEAATA